LRGLDHHVADVHANAEVDVLVGRYIRVRLGQSILRLHRALHGVNGASELSKDTVAGCIGYAAPCVPQ
jgi:hypothetical protein